METGQTPEYRSGEFQRRGMETPEPGTREEAADWDGTQAGPTEPTDKEHTTTEETGIQPYIAGHSGATNQETDQRDATNGETKQEYATNGETDQEHSTNGVTDQEHATNGVTDQEHATNGVTDQEHSTNQESEKFGTTNEEADVEQSFNKERGMAKEPGTEREHATNAESETLEMTGNGETTEEERTDTDQENSSSDHQKEELVSTEPSPDTSELDITPEEEDELKVTDGADNEDPGTARYQETPSEPPEEEDTPYQLDTSEKEETEPQEDHEQDTTEDKQVREALIQQYHMLVSEKEKVQQRNSQLQHKLYEYFRRKKGEETRPEVEKHVSDQEQRYLKYLAMLEDMRKKVKADTLLHEQQIEELRVQCQDVVSQVDKEWSDFQEQKKKIALYIVNRGAGKHAASSYAQEVMQLQAKEERKAKEVIQVRLENIKFKNQINHHESTLRSKEELAEGLHLIDFEQLKIENQTYNEKIEERNEELLKLRKKITNTVQVLTHLKEKLQFVQNENQEQRDRLMEIEALVAHKRDILTRTKQARDSLRMDNLNLKQKCGLLGNKTLLRDFEEKVDATEELSQKLENLKRRHAELTLSSKGVMRKIKDTKVIIEG